LIGEIGGDKSWAGDGPLVLSDVVRRPTARRNLGATLRILENGKGDEDRPVLLSMSLTPANGENDGGVPLTLPSTD
jgi:hypothetical protein